MSEPTIEEEKGVRSSLGRSTNIQLWLAIIVSMVIGTWAVKDQTWKTRVDMRLTAIEITVATTEPDRWTKTEMQLWIAETKLLNPDISLPEVK